MTLFGCFSPDDLTNSAKTKRDNLPEDIEGSLEWLKKMSERQKQLQELEELFRETRDSKYLTEFLPERNFPKEELKEPIGQQAALFDPRHCNSKEALQQQHDDVKRLFPDIEIREVTTTTGERRIAYIGTDPKTLVGALKLLAAERKTQSEIDKGTDHLKSLLIDTTSKNTLAEQPDQPAHGVSFAKKAPDKSPHEL